MTSLHLSLTRIAGNLRFSREAMLLSRAVSARSRKHSHAREKRQPVDIP